MAAHDTGLPPDPIDDIHTHVSRIEGLVFALWLLGQEIDRLDRAGRPCSGFHALLETIEERCAAITAAAEAIHRHNREARS